MEINQKVKLVPFPVPKYVYAEITTGKQAGYNPTIGYLISELDDEILDALCEQFRTDVFAKKAKGE